MLGSSGGIPGELNGGWRTGSAANGATMDLEYGFSCMGYEIAGPWGASMARAQTHPDGLVTTLLGDGSHLILNSELFSAAFAGHPFVAVVCDNGGYAVIHRLQTNQGADGFNNLLTDCAGPGAKPGGVRVDFALHAQALGCAVVDVPAGASVDDLRAGYATARELASAERRPAVLVCRTHLSSWTESGAWWEVGVPAGLSGRAASIRRFAERTRAALEPAHLEAQELLDRSGGVEELSRMYDRLLSVVESRPSAKVVPIQEGEIATAYRALLGCLS